MDAQAGIEPGQAVWMPLATCFPVDGYEGQELTSIHYREAPSGELFIDYAPLGGTRGALVSSAAVLMRDSLNGFEVRPGFANRGLTHTTYAHEEDRLPLLRPLDTFLPVAGAVRRGRTLAVD